MATSLKQSKKRSPDRENSRNYLSFDEKIVKFGPVDPEIICLKLKKEEINARKIYSPVGRFAARAKKCAAKPVTQPQFDDRPLFSILV